MEKLLRPVQYTYTIVKNYSTLSAESASQSAHASDSLSGVKLLQRQSTIVRWYILQVPAWNRRLTAELDALNARCAQRGLPTFEYFSPVFKQAKTVNGKFKICEKPLLFNYVFIRSSQANIYQMMMEGGLAKYSFLPMVKSEEAHFPYLTDETMENLRWIAHSYGSEIPVYLPQPDKLIVGDRIRITDGPFKGCEATVVTSSGAVKHKVMAGIDNLLWVPLFEVKSGQYEIVELSRKGQHKYEKLSSQRVFQELHELLQKSIRARLAAQEASAISGADATAGKAISSAIAVAGNAAAGSSDTARDAAAACVALAGGGDFKKEVPAAGNSDTARDAAAEAAKSATIAATNVADATSAAACGTLAGSGEASALSPAERERLRQIIREYHALQLDTDLLRSKQYAILLLAYSAIGESREAERAAADIKAFLRYITSETARALLVVTLYGCTNSSIWYAQAHRMVDKWSLEDSLKPAKKELVECVASYDALYGHQQ